MTYEQALDFIYGVGLTGPKPGLRRIQKLLASMGNPQDKLKFVHIAGTNGKGSTSTMISYVLKEAGYKTGLNISPYILDFCERIQINNQMIPKATLAEITKYVKIHWELVREAGDTPSMFEIIVAIALEYFAREECDVVVLEVGIGGRLDASNVIDTPLASVITSISKDHTQQLGNTIAEIAFEKAGIIKKNGVTISYPKQTEEALAVLMERCAIEGNQLLINHDYVIESIGLGGSRFTSNGLAIEVPLVGEHQIYNAMAVITTCQALNQRGLSITDENIVNGICKTRFPARAEVLSRNPLIIVDGAHNASGAKALVSTIKAVSKEKVHCVIGVMRDKTPESLLAEIGVICTSVITTSLPDMPRFTPPEELALLAEKYCNKVSVELNPEKALLHGVANMGKGDVLVVCGSLYLASYLRPYIMKCYDKEEFYGSTAIG